MNQHNYTVSKRGVAALKRVLKNAAKWKWNPEALRYSWLDEDGGQIVCDGFRLFRLVEPVELPDKSDMLEVPNTAERLLKEARGYSYAMPTPTEAEVRAFIVSEKEANGKGHIPKWDFGSRLPTVNALYLLDLLIVFPHARLYVRDELNYLSPIYATSDAGEAILLPIRDERKQPKQPRKRQ